MTKHSYPDIPQESAAISLTLEYVSTFSNQDDLLYSLGEILIKKMLPSDWNNGLQK